VFRSAGDIAAVAGADELLREHRDHWFVREVLLYWTRTLKRLDLSARSLITLVEPGSCFTGTLAELVLGADRSFMLLGTFEDADGPPAVLQLTEANTGWYPMSNGLTRLQSRFYGHGERQAEIESSLGKELSAELAGQSGLVTFTPDDIDWQDEIRLTLEERASFSPDALTGMEANFRFVGPETMETKIFGRLSTWQNWIFQRPNAAGTEGALRRYGTGSRPTYDQKRT
jgi:benzoyl-CoA-dihydrodiol lyase